MIDLLPLIMIIHQYQNEFMAQMLMNGIINIVEPHVKPSFLIY
jgi:hypothetical protein